MTIFEKKLRDALELLDGAQISGMENRARVSRAEQEVYAVAEMFARMEKEGRLRVEKEEKQHDHNDDGQGNDA